MPGSQRLLMKDHSSKSLETQSVSMICLVTTTPLQIKLVPRKQTWLREAELSYKKISKFGQFNMQTLKNSCIISKVGECRRHPRGERHCPPVGFPQQGRIIQECQSCSDISRCSRFCKNIFGWVQNQPAEQNDQS